MASFASDGTDEPITEVEEQKIQLVRIRLDTICCSEHSVVSDSLILEFLNKYGGDVDKAVPELVCDCLTEPTSSQRREGHTIGAVGGMKQIVGQRMPYRPTHQSVFSELRSDSDSDDENPVADFNNLTLDIQQKCQICLDGFSPNKMCSMLLCPCNICITCAKKYFESMLKEKQVQDFVCPVCQQPDKLTTDSELEIHRQYLSIKLKNSEPELLSYAQQDLLDTKMVEFAMKQEPLFRYCANNQCSGGFTLPSNEKLLVKVKCPYCTQWMCHECKTMWDEHHEGKSCKEFSMWKRDNNPDIQQDELNLHMEENGIECPKCRTEYSLARVGCRHLKCTHCSYEFCSGCRQPFLRGRQEKCPGTCSGIGFHCHHPRDCIYYLEDYSVPDLVSLLEKHKVVYQPYDSMHDIGARSVGQCFVKCLENETTDVEVECGKEAWSKNAGLCEQHYKEYLVRLIRKNRIDPVVTMTVDEIKQLFIRHGLSVPASFQGELPDDYRSRIIKMVKKFEPLA